MASYGELLQSLDAWFSRGREAAGDVAIPCRRACTACCHGVFDVSPADAALLAEGLAALPADQVETLRSRATGQLVRCAEVEPRWGPPWRVDALPEATFDALTERLSGAPCPALGDDGGCAVYEHRPATCRMTGLAMDAGVAGRLDNECPIQGDHPDYAALAPEPFDLMAFEVQAERHDAAAEAHGHHETTVAGALVRG